MGRAAATIIYTFVGGFLAVSWTDTVQASLMIFALILTPVIVIISVGGFGDSLEVIKQKSIENIDMLKGLNFVAIISLMGWGAGLFRSAAYSGALYGGGFAPQYRSRTSH
ncbi:proline:sodium symporter PutP [Klebsiella pneumoniae]|nr:proline:sodium symporter PutP [Klebsiella pneumoniae]